MIVSIPFCSRVSMQLSALESLSGEYVSFHTLLFAGLNATVGRKIR